MGLFKRGDKVDKYAGRDAIAQAEVDRLVALTPAELGVELLPAIGADGAKARNKIGVAPMQVIQWLMRSVGRGVSSKPLVPAILAGLSAMQNAGLLEARGSGIGTGTNTYCLTPVGEQALADGTGASCLNP
jgi:hypothetical protein